MNASGIDGMTSSEVAAAIHRCHSHTVIILGAAKKAGLVSRDGSARYGFRWRSASVAAEYRVHARMAYVARHKVAKRLAKQREREGRTPDQWQPLQKWRSVWPTPVVTGPRSVFDLAAHVVKRDSPGVAP